MSNFKNQQLINKKRRRKIKPGDCKAKQCIISSNESFSMTFYPLFFN